MVIVRVDDACRPTGDLGQGGTVGDDRRRAAAHRFEQGDAEALGEGRQKEEIGAGVEGRQEVVGEEVEQDASELGEQPSSRAIATTGSASAYRYAAASSVSTAAHRSWNRVGVSLPWWG